MEPVPQALLTLGGVLLVGLVADLVGGRVGVPRVTLLLLLGVAVGPEVLDVLPPITENWFPIASTLALTMVGFLVGGELRSARMRRHATTTLAVAVIQGVVTALVVIAGSSMLGASAALALSLGGIAVATDPAATITVVQERRADGPLTRTLIGVTALDDVIALALFGVLLTTATAVSERNGDLELLGEAAWEVFGAVGLGLALGVPAAALTGRLRPGRPTQEEAYALVLVGAGLALWLQVSFLLMAVVLGATIAGRATHHERTFTEIERIEWPALIVFFVLAGASLDLGALRDVGLLGVGYVVLRTLGKVGGCTLGVRAAGQPAELGHRLGMAMLPQAGVAIGLTLLAAERFPDVAAELIPLVVAATIVFELVGPVATTVALQRAGEVDRAPERRT